MTVSPSPYRKISTKEIWDFIAREEKKKFRHWQCTLMLNKLKTLLRKHEALSPFGDGGEDDDPEATMRALELVVQIIDTSADGTDDDE